MFLPFLLCLVVGLLAGACAAGPRGADPGPRTGDEVRVCGELFHTGTRVVLWDDPGGYDATLRRCFFHPGRAAPSRAPGRIARYGRRRGAPPPGEPFPVETLRSLVTQIVLHYDAAGTSRRCFEVLQDIRGLSCHFLLDLDGTVYQTLDLRERAWHAGSANDRSVGVEIANIGAYRDRAAVERWYARHPLPSGAGGGRGLVRGSVKGRDLWQHDFTDAQYRALGRLVAALCRVLDVPPAFPRDARGRVIAATLPPGEAREFRGILGHLHLSPGKIDPGPAFDWERLFAALGRGGVR